MNKQVVVNDIMTVVESVSIRLIFCKMNSRGNCTLVSLVLYSKYKYTFI